MPDISTIDGIDILTLANFQGVPLTSGSLINGQTATLITDAHTLISTQTASSSSSLSFTSGIDSTYDVYEWHFINMHPSSDAQLQFQVNAVGQTGFDEVITSSYFAAYHDETGVYTTLAAVAQDQGQGTSYQGISNYTGNDNDQSYSGILKLYSPSSTTFAKHFISRGNDYHGSDYSFNIFVSGYINTTSAIDEIDFKFSLGTIDAGQIRMYGVAKS